MWPASGTLIDPNREGTVEKPDRGLTDAWPVAGEGGNHESQSAVGADSKYASWDGTLPLVMQLPGNLPIESLVTYVSTVENITVYAGAGVITGPPLFQTSGAAGTFRVPGAHPQITLVADSAFMEGSIPIFFSGEKLPPTVALQEVSVVVSQGIPKGATPIAAEGQFAITGPGTTNISFTPAVPVGLYAVGITFADISFDAALTTPQAIMLQQQIASLQFPLMVLTTGNNARSYNPGPNVLFGASISLTNITIKAIGGTIPAGEIYYNILGYYGRPGI